MEEFDLDIIARKSIKGVFALVSRTFLIQVLGIVASFILTVFLDPASYGVFFVVSAIIIFLNYFQDIGLAAALIQKKDPITREELTTTFTAQQVLVLSAVIPTLIFSKQIASFYGLNQDGYMLFIALVFSFFLSSLRTIPTILLERNLNFNKLVIPQILENIFYNVALIIFAVMGFGINSFTIAVVLRGIVGLISTYLVQPWKIGFSFSRPTFRRLISYGIPFQANSLLALVKDDLLIIYIGKVLPLSQVGYIGFAQKWAFLPLRLIMDNVIKITFPSMSRLQHDENGLRVAIEKSLFMISFFIFPAAVGLIMFSSSLITLIPRYEKWEPTVLALTFFALNSVFSSISTPLTNFLNAIGKVKITLIFMVIWTALTWILTPLFIFLYGFNGVALASFVVSISSIFVIVVARRYVKFSFVRPVARQFAAAIVMLVFILLTRNIITSFSTLFLEMAFSGIIYLGVLMVIARNDLLKTSRFVFESIRK